MNVSNVQTLQSPHHTAGGTETLAAAVWRRTRRAVALVVAVTIMLKLGGGVLGLLAGLRAEDPLVLALGHAGLGLLCALVLAALVVLSAAACAGICYPDTPHAGLFYALIGLAALAARGSGVLLLLRRPDFYPAMLLESLLWIGVLGAVLLATAWVYEQLFKNDLWRSHRAPPARVRVVMLGGPLIGLTATVDAASIVLGPARLLKTYRLNPALSNLGAMFATAAIGLLVTACFAKTELRGQVLFATFAGFMVGGMLAFGTFPRGRAWCVALSVPIAGLLGYLLSQILDPGAAYPGHPASPLGRALPIDYASAGTAGALFGHYLAYRWYISEALEAVDEDEVKA